MRTLPTLAVAVASAALAGCRTDFTTQPTPDRNRSPRLELPLPAFSLKDREAVACGLPAGVALADGVRVSGKVWGRQHVVTVEEALAELGARAGEDGKLRDRAGKEIRFWRNPLEGRGTPYFPDEPQRVQDELEQLKKQFTVIEFDYYPGKEKGYPPPLACAAAAR